MLNQPKRLAIVMPSFYEQLIGGAEHQTYLLADAAKRRGYDVHYIFVSEASPYRNHLKLTLHTICPIRLPKRFGAFWWVYCLSAGRLLRKIRPDAVYVRGGWSFAGMAAAYARRHRCSSTWHVASSADVTPRPFLSLIKRPSSWIEQKAIEYAIRYSTHVVAQANYQSRLLLERYGRESTVIMNQQPEPEEALDKSGPFTVAWVGNIKPLKQPEMFIRLAAEFVGNRSVRFVMIGRPAGGKYQSGLDVAIRECGNLEYLGEQPIEKVNAILAQSHLLVNTSLYEGFSNTFVQAWMREVPVVSMLLDPDGILTTRKIGFFSGSFERMIRDVRTLVEDPALRDEMQKRAREYASENHSLKKNMDRLLDLVMAE